MFETKNTKLAAALLSVGFELDESTEFTGQEVVLRIRDGLAFGYSPDELQGLWRDRNWQEQNKHHPFMHIIKVAEAREWLLNRVIYRYGANGERPECDTFSTDELSLAACIVAEGYYLMYFECKTFYFSKTAELVAQRYRHPDESDVINRQCRYLSVLKGLLEQIRNRNTQFHELSC